MLKVVGALLALTLVVCPRAVAQTVPRREVRATRLAAPLTLDGRLDEDVYAKTTPTSDFAQQFPREGAPATEATEVWVFFDEHNIYVSARCTDSHPERIIANEMRRDHSNIFGVNDSFTVVFDTFFDQRNGVFFQTNPIGAIRDQAITDGAQNSSWNTVWDVKSARTATGYTVEMAIPFKSLRYRGAGPQVWGINARRMVRWKNELSTLSPLPASYGSPGIGQVGRAATLVGLETPAQSLNLELKPYGGSTLTTDLASAKPFRNDVSPAAGFDVKYGLTRGLTSDLTVNTDFAQVEEDQQQVNLTRFNLLFPEKRDFFLEGQGIFEFGGQAGSFNTNSSAPILFFSRRVGLSNGQAVPVIAGGRVTGKAGAFDVGALSVRTGDKPEAGAAATTFSAVRLRRNVLRRSSIGLIATGRWPALSGADDNTAGGIDADFRLFTNVQALAFAARTSTPGRTGDDASYRGRFAYTGDRYGFEADHITVERHFNPEAGFLRRTDFSGNWLSARFSPRLTKSRVVRRLSLDNDFEHIMDARRTSLQDRTYTGALGVEFHSSDQISASISRHFERLPLDFPIAPHIVVPKGGYDWTTLTGSYTLAQQRSPSGTISASLGSFYGGTRRTATYTGRLGLSPHLAVEPSLSLNWVDLPYGDFSARLAAMRLVVSPTVRLGISSFVQYNATTHSLTSSARMRWEYTPGSELFVVYSDGRDTVAPGFPRLLNRSFAVKVTRLLRF